MGKPFFDAANKTWKVKAKVDGKWVNRTLKGAADEAAAIEAAAALAKPAVLQDAIVVPTATGDLRAYCKAYLADHPKQGANGVRRREGLLRRFCDYADGKGWKTLASIGVTEIKDWVKHRREVESAGDATIVSDLAIIQGVFTEAIDEGIVTENPAKRQASKARARVVDSAKRSDKKIKYYTREQQAKVFAVLPLAQAKYRELAIVMLATGMRHDAARHMEASWVKGEFMVSVPSARDKGGKGYTTHIFGQDAQAIVARRCREHPSGSIFPEIKGEASTYHYFAEFYKRHAERHGLSDIVELGSFNHIWRHTFAVRMVEDEMPIPVVQKFMGHSDIRITMMYAEVSDDALQHAVKAIEARRG